MTLKDNNTDNLLGLLGAEILCLSGQRGENLPMKSHGVGHCGGKLGRQVFNLFELYIISFNILLYFASFRLIQLHFVFISYFSTNH